MAAIRILAFAGSLRRESWNKKLVQIAALGTRDAGVETNYIDLRDFPLPVFDEDLEKSDGLPENARRLKRLFLEHQGLLIGSPEYNSSITAALKNAIDWVSRKEGNEPGLAAFSGKVAALLSASPGALGGLRGLVHLRAILGNIGVLVIPEQITVPRAHEALAGDGIIRDEALHERVKKLGRDLAGLLEKLHAR